MVRERFFASMVMACVGVAGGLPDAVGQTVRVVAESGEQVSFGGVQWTLEGFRQGFLSINDNGLVAFPTIVRAQGASVPVGAIAVSTPTGWVLRSHGESVNLARFFNLAEDGAVLRGNEVLTAAGPIAEPSDGDPVPGLDVATFSTPMVVERLGNDGTLVRLLRYQQNGTSRIGLFGGYGANLRALELPVMSNGFWFSMNQPAIAGNGRYALAGEWRDATGTPRRAIMLGEATPGTLRPIVLDSQAAENLPAGVMLWDFGQSISTTGFSGIGINAHGDVVFNAWLAGPGVNSGNQSVVAVVRDGVAKVLIRRGDATPGGGTFGVPLGAPAPVAISDSGHVLALVQDQGGYGRNDTVLWKIDPDGTLHELVRPGQAVPGRSDGAVWPIWSQATMGYSMNQRGDVLVIGPDDHVVFEASGVVRNVWAIGRDYLTKDGQIVRAARPARPLFSGSGGNDGLGRRINQHGAVCVTTENAPSTRRVLVIEPSDSPCDSVDFNYDASLFDPTDVDAFMSVFSEGPCIPAHAICGDADFNNDGAAGPEDIESFLSVFGEGPCV